MRILASPINPSDLLYVRRVCAGVQPHFPAPVGFEGVGVVDTLGPAVEAGRPQGDDSLQPGQRVGVVNGKGGYWAEYAVVPAGDLLPVPDDLPDAQIASFIINPASALLMLHHVLAIPAGAWLLQSAASSELGRMIIRLAGRRILEVFWLGYWLPRLDASARRQLVQQIVALLRERVLTTSAAHPFSLDEVSTAVTQAETPGRQGKILLVPQGR